MKTRLDSVRSVVELIDYLRNPANAVCAMKTQRELADILEKITNKTNTETKMTDDERAADFAELEEDDKRALATEEHIYEVEITAGWNGAQLLSWMTATCFDDLGVSNCLRAFANEKGVPFHEVWNVTQVADDIRIIDFGSHTYFGRVKVVK